MKISENPQSNIINSNAIPTEVDKPSRTVEEEYNKIIQQAFLNLSESAKPINLSSHTSMILSPHIEGRVSQADEISKTVKSQQARNNVSKAKVDTNKAKLETKKVMAKQKEMQVVISKPNLQALTHIKTGEKITTDKDPNKILEELKSGERAHIDFEKGIAKFYIKPKTETITHRDSEGREVVLKCVEMTAEEKEALLADLEEYRGLYLELQQLKAEEHKDREKMPEFLTEDILTYTIVIPKNTVYDSKNSHHSILKIEKLTSRIKSERPGKSNKEIMAELFELDRKRTEKFLTILHKCIEDQNLQIELRNAEINGMNLKFEDIKRGVTTTVQITFKLSLVGLSSKIIKLIKTQHINGGIAKQAA